jgi:glycosyltransferase involved in cell wall biosynthesis
LTSARRDGPYVILSPERWVDSARTNKHHLARELSRDAEVLYVNISPASLDRIWPMVSIFQPTKTLHVSDSIGVPVRLRQRYGWAAGLQSALALLGARRASAQTLSDQAKIVLAYFPLPPSLLRLLQPQLVVYHCVDYHASFPAWRGIAPQLLAWEESLTRTSALVLASSASLARHLGQWRSDVHLLENVGDVDLFAIAGNRARLRPRPSKPERQTAFFHGTFSSHKVNFDFLTRVAQASPDLELRLVGDLPDEEARQRMADLTARSNVSWAPATDQATIAEMIETVDILLLPYATNEHTQYVFPIKLTEYLATGMPIISTRLETVRQFSGDSVYYADDAGEVSAALEKVVGHDESAVRRTRNLVRGRTWSARADEIRVLVSEALDERASR